TQVRRIGLLHAHELASVKMNAPCLARILRKGRARPVESIGRWHVREVVKVDRWICAAVMYERGELIGGRQSPIVESAECLRIDARHIAARVALAVRARAAIRRAGMAAIRRLIR